MTHAAAWRGVKDIVLRERERKFIGHINILKVRELQETYQWLVEIKLKGGRSTFGDGRVVYDGDCGYTNLHVIKLDRNI